MLSVIAAAYFAPAATLTWQFIGTSIADGGGSFFFTDTNAWKFPSRFYRSLGP